MLKLGSIVAVLVNLSSLKRWKTVVCTAEPNLKPDAVQEQSSSEHAAGTWSVSCSMHERGG